MKKAVLISFLALLAISIPFLANAASININVNVSGLFAGLWNGLLAPYTLVLRWFIPGLAMYACQNASWLYDFGFLIGIFFSLPLGWIAVIIGLLLHLF